MNFQQILTIPFYFNIINTAFTELQITKYGMDQRSILFKSEIQLVDDIYYIKKPDKTLVPIDYNNHEKDRNEDLIKFLVTAKVFEDTDRSPLGMYMLYKVKFPNGNAKSGYRQMGLIDEDSRGTFSEFSRYFDPIFYQTLVILNDKKD